MASRYDVYWAKTDDRKFKATMQAFSQAVEGYLRSGWQLQGGVSVAYGKDAFGNVEIVIAQAFVA